MGIRIDWEIFGPIVAFIIFILFIFGLIWMLHAIECRDVGKTMGVPYRYNFWSGCYIQPQEARNWIPLDGYYFKEE